MLKQPGIADAQDDTHKSRSVHQISSELLRAARKRPWNFLPALCFCEHKTDCQFVTFIGYGRPRCYRKRIEDRAVCTERGMQNGVRPGEAVPPEMGNPNLFDPAPVTAVEFLSGVNTAAAEPDVVDPAYGAAPDMEARATTTLQPPPVSPPEPMSSVVTPPSGSTVRVQEFYSAESRQERTERSGFQWMARITEFLRTTATRSATNVDRMLDNLGFPHIQPQTQNEGVVFSPPQDLQPRTLVPAMPASWSTMRGQTSLFSEEQLAQMRSSQRNHPQIYGPLSDGESDRSSRLQAEVQRQMEEYMQKHQSEVKRLQREVLELRQERQRLLHSSDQARLAASSGMCHSYLKVVPM